MKTKDIETKTAYILLILLSTPDILNQSVGFTKHTFSD